MENQKARPSLRVAQRDSSYEAQGRERSTTGALRPKRSPAFVEQFTITRRPSQFLKVQEVKESREQRFPCQSYNGQQPSYSKMPRLE
ncbi:Hypothetical predicted protein, partial [Prunus dulcis]